MIDACHVRFMQQLGRSYRALVAGFEAHTGHSMARWRILVLLMNAGELSQKQLARELGIDPAALTRQLKAMQADGLVVRHSDSRDARLINVALTKAGEQTVHATMPSRNAYIEWALGDFEPAQLDAFSDALQVLETRLTRRT